jgi:hypothetical protein
MKASQMPTSVNWEGNANSVRSGSSAVAALFQGHDPLGFDAGDANLYRYVGNGPTNATDPSGLEEAPKYGDKPIAGWVAVEEKSGQKKGASGTFLWKIEKNPAPAHNGNVGSLHFKWTQHNKKVGRKTGHSWDIRDSCRGPAWGGHSCTAAVAVARSAYQRAHPVRSCWTKISTRWRRASGRPVWASKSSHQAIGW